MKAVLTQLLKEIESGSSAVWVTIVSKGGSAPRGSGSQMLVGHRGRIVGTIGGGAVEYQSEKMALELLSERRSSLHHFQLHTNSTEDIGMVCGGDVSIWFQFVDAQKSEWVIFADKLRRLLSSKAGGWIALHLDGNPPTLYDSTQKAIAGTTMESFNLPMTDIAQQRVSHFIMPIPAPERAVIFGGGHCAQALVPILDSVGFRVVVMDDRPEYAQTRLFPRADSVICGNFEKIADSISLTSADYVVIMTSGHSHDLDVERQVLPLHPIYLGVIGSRNKVEHTNRALRKMGFNDDILMRVHSPIGLSIKAVTPEEIAVSIAGEMILERAISRSI